MTHLQYQIHKTITNRGKAGWNMFTFPGFTRRLELDYIVAQCKDKKQEILLSESITV